jgi:predicted dehydrogenase
MKKIKIGILGCANIAKNQFIPALLELNNLFEIVGIASRTQEKANEFTSLFKIKSFVGYENLLNENIDAVYIPLPTGLHQKWVNIALKRGIHVYAEKSLSFSVVQTQEMIKNAKENNLVLMEGYTFLLHPQHKIVQSLLNENEIGEIRSFSSKFGFPPLPLNNFRYDKNIGGGVLFDAAGYPIKACRLILGNNLTLKSATMNLTKQFGSAFFTNNGVGINVSFGFDNYYQCNYEIWGTKGKILVQKAFTPRADDEPSIILEQNNIFKEIKAPKCNQFIEAIKKFYNLIFTPLSRENEFKDILAQSETLENIQLLSR